MIIEQAAVCLPEILVGSGYAKQDYEAGIVSGLSLAILQELNGRGISNPISCLCAERSYPDIDKNLRADLHVRLDRLYSGSKAYSEFGFRYSNWIEAKFFRTRKGTPPSTQNLGAVVADLIRLVVLVPTELAKDKNGDNTNHTVTGRYFLHAYRGDPLKHLNPKRKARGAQPRSWVEPLIRPGNQTIDDFELTGESKTFFQHLGRGMQNASLVIKLTNFVFKPVSPAGDNYYTIILSRIDSGAFELHGRNLTLGSDRTMQIVPAGELQDLRDEVASILKPTKSEASASDPAEDINNDSEDTEKDQEE